jgi:DNA polymerase (family 10)
VATVDNVRIARAFDELADLLELLGDSEFKCRAYRVFAERARGLEESIAELSARGELAELSGVGRAIASKVDELERTGTCDALERARARVPATLRDVLRVPGLGIKTVRKLWRDAGISSLSELAYACEENRLAGFGEKKQWKTLAEVRAILEGEGSLLLATAVEMSRRLRTTLTAVRAASEVREVGDVRRGVELVRGLEAIARGASAKRMARALAAAKGAIECIDVEIVDAATVRATFVGGAQANVVAVDAAQWVHALVERTGSTAHVRWLESLAADAGGLASVCARAKREEDVYAALGIPFAAPELREGPTPDPVDVIDGVRGIFHVHTDWSDGAASIVAMARAAADAGFAYVGISDHSQAAIQANGLAPTRLREQAAAMKAARAEVGDATQILHGIEVDILADGALDLPDDTLAELDFVIASVHSRFAMSASDMTARIVRAVSHPLVTILGHPTGRLLLGRRGYTFDVEAVARAAAANDTWLEINANPQRLDLSDTLARRAAASGARFVVDPDAHSPHGISDTSLGVTVARRAGLGPDRILNSKTRPEIVAYLAERRQRRE